MNPAKRTSMFLRTLTKHLSSRPECRKLTYRCVIGLDDTHRKQLDIIDILGRDNSKYISFDPAIRVYPTKYHRNTANKVNVVDHVLQTYFPEVIDGTDILGNTTIHTNMLVKGVYEYQLSITGKRRRWAKIS